MQTEPAEVIAPDIDEDLNEARTPSGAEAPYVRVIGKAVAVLDLFLEDDHELTLSELSRRLRMSRSTVHRLLSTLERHQLVDRTENGGYRLGIHLFRLGSAVEVRAVLGRIAEPMLTWLGEKFSVSSYLSVRDGDQALCLARVDRGPVKATAYQVGETLPLYLGAGPMILLSALPDAEIGRVLERPVHPLTPRTTVSPDEIWARLREIRASGLAYAADDVQAGLAAMGAPVRDRSGAIVAAASVVALTPWFNREHYAAMAEAVRTAAQQIGADLSAR